MEACNPITVIIFSDIIQISEIENMKKIILYIAASLDQRIAEADGGLEWLTTTYKSGVVKVDYMIDKTY